MARLLASRATSVGSQYVCSRCLRQSVAAKRRAFSATARARQEGQSVLSLLEQRGLVNQIAGDRNSLDRHLRTKQVGVYAGIDPTAPSLHLGHLLPLMVLFWLYHHGHSIVSLVGGATARVGDPSGRLTSRAETAGSVHDTNFRAMYEQVGRIWDNAARCGEKYGYGGRQAGKREMLNNADWLKRLGVLEFLKMMGSGMRLGAMLGRDTVRNKMEKGDGMSFSEFTYPLLQAWDWWHMYNSHDPPVQVQVGGSDQYGNIVAGMDAVKFIAQNSDGNKCLDAEGRFKDERLPMGLTVPLLTTSSGEKFGKSAGNAVWLDDRLTSAFDLYGFLLRSSDEDVERYLKLLTFVPTHEIATVMDEHSIDPGKRRAQHLLASEVLELAHGRKQAEETRAQHQALRSLTLASLSQKAEDDESAYTGPGSASQQRTVLPSSLVLNTPFSRILYHAGVVPTKSEGARLIAKGGAYVAVGAREGAGSELEFVQIRDQKPDEVVGFVLNGLLIFRTGKWKVRVMEVVEDEAFEAQGLDAPGWPEWRASHKGG